MSRILTQQAYVEAQETALLKVVQVSWGDLGCMGDLGTMGCTEQGGRTRGRPGMGFRNVQRGVAARTAAPARLESLNKSGQGTQETILLPFPLLVDHQTTQIPGPNLPSPHLSLLPL